MGFWSSCFSIASSVVSGISSAIGSIGSAVSSFAATVAPVIGNIINAIQPMAATISKFANAFLQGLDILKPDEKIDVLGERALQAAEQGIKIEGFERFDDYLEALRKFELDPQKSGNRSMAEKITSGLAVGTVAVENKFNSPAGSLNGMWLLPMTNPDYFTPERIQGWIAAGQLGRDVYAYLEKSLSGTDSYQFENGLKINIDSLPMRDSEMKELYKALDTSQNNWANMEKAVEKSMHEAPRTE